MKKALFKKTLALVVSTLMVVSIVFISCNKDDDKPSGKSVAQEMCNCFKKADGDESKIEDCIETIYDKYENIADEDDDKFWDNFYTEFEKEIEKCDAPGDWEDILYYGYW